MSVTIGFYFLLGVIITLAIATAYTKIMPRLRRMFSKRKLIDLAIIEKIATCANSIGLHNDIAGEKILVFTYENNTYAIRSDCSLAWEFVPNKWRIMDYTDGIDLLNAMQPRKAKQQNNDNQSGNKQRDNNGNKNQNNSQNGNGNKDNNRNVIDNSQAEKWVMNERKWENKPNFTLNNPYSLILSDAEDHTNGYWIVVKRSKNGNK